LQNLADMFSAHRHSPMIAIMIVNLGLDRFRFLGWRT